MKEGGGLAGHNGLRSITQHLKTQDYLRVRIGVGKPPSKERGADHVLRRIPKRERELLDVAVQVAADAVEAIATDGVATGDDRLQRPLTAHRWRDCAAIWTAERPPLRLVILGRPGAGKGTQGDAARSPARRGPPLDRRAAPAGHGRPAPSSAGWPGPTWSPASWSPTT